MPLYQDEGVVLRTVKLGEADRHVTMAKSAPSPKVCVEPNRVSEVVWSLSCASRCLLRKGVRLM